MTARELVEEIEARGGRLALNGEKINYVIPEDADAGDLIERLRELKPQVIEVLRRRAGLPWFGYHNNQPFVCAKCGTAFDTRAGFAKHQVYQCSTDSAKQWGLTTSV